MRIVVFDVSGVLEAFDYRGVLFHAQVIQAEQKLKLPFTQKNLFKFNGVVFGVCEGVGDLDYKDYPKNINFNALLVDNIENYLLNGEEPKNTQQKALLTDFLEVYDKNIEKGFYYLDPSFFKEKESANNEINTNKTQSLEAITQEKQQATSEITEAKKTDHYHNIDFFEIE
ncbi:hypothetical protein JT248_03310 [Helicobacter pylori]|nr:hypothetical protein [Helicobacter pylori]